jgi:type II secretory pathway component PulF
VGDRDPATLDPGKGPSWYERIFFGRVSSGQLATFCRQFAAYLNAGVDIGKAMTDLQKQFRMTALGPVIGRLSLAVKRGDSFAEAVAREPEAFDPLFVGMIRVAEARGGIPETLKSLGRHYESRQSLIRQARSAMIYPIAVIAVACGVVALLTIWLIPMFASLLRDVAGPSTVLPLPTRFLLGLSDFVQKAGWFLIPLAMVGTPFLLLWFYKTPGGKKIMDRVLLVTPVFGQLLKKLDTTRFARTLSALLDAGVDVGSSLELTADVVRLDPFRRAVLNTKTEVMQGSELSAAMDRTRRFGPDVIAIVSSGEETGKLPESLNHLADDYEEQVAYMVRNMGQLIQPLLMILLGGVVLFIILAVFLPYLNILSSLAGGGH